MWVTRTNTKSSIQVCSPVQIFTPWLHNFLKGISKTPFTDMKRLQVLFPVNLELDSLRSLDLFSYTATFELDWIQSINNSRQISGSFDSIYCAIRLSNETNKWRRPELSINSRTSLNCVTLLWLIMSQAVTKENLNGAFAIKAWKLYYSCWQIISDINWSLA